MGLTPILEARMADRVRRVSYWYFEVIDQPGEGAKLFEKLRDQKLNLLHFTAFPLGGGKAQVDVVPENPTAFADAVKRAGLRATGPKDAFLVQGGDRPGAAAETLRKLAAAKVNVTAANASVAQGGGFGMIVWVPAADLAAASKALGA